MALRFRKTFSLLSGLKLNIGKKSASVRVGVKGFGFTTGTAGQTVSASLSRCDAWHPPTIGEGQRERAEA
jgi:hypothetical protein